MQDDRKALVPQLRFPEFRGMKEWGYEELSVLADKVTKKNQGNARARVLTNSAEFGIVDQRDYFNKDIADKSNLEGYLFVDQGDYVYNPRISSIAPVGPISKNHVGDGVMSPLYTVFRFHGAQNAFYEKYFQSRHWHGYLKQVANTGARHDRMSIANGDFMAMPLPSPDPDEQQKIADCLTAIDERITATDARIDALKAHKKGLMQQLFPREGEATPRLRFPEFRDAPVWVETNLKAGIELISGQHLAREDYAEHGEIPYFTGPSDYVDDLSSVGKWTAVGSHTARKDDTLITVKGSGVGELLYLRLKVVALGRQLMAIRSRTFVDMFVFHYLSTKRRRLTELAMGNLIPGLARGDILGLGICVPSEAEQQKIADCLSSLDELTAATTAQRDALRQHKKGMMQQLFPSPAEDTA